MFLTSLLVRLTTLRNERGATAVEYGIMVALIAAIIIGTVGILGGQVDTAFTTITTALNGGTPVPVP